MQQRQLRLGDILDDYCPRERRVTNHAVVAMVGDDVKQTRCTTCDAEHEYKHARVPRQRKKGDAPAALYAQVAAGAPKRVVQNTAPNGGDQTEETPAASVEQPPEHEPGPAIAETPAASAVAPLTHERVTEPADEDQDEQREDEKDEGPIHRRLIRASLPRPEGQQPPGRPIPEFTIRQPGGRPGRFRPRHPRGGHGPQGHQFQGGNRSGSMGGSARGPRPSGGHAGPSRRHGPHGRKRSK